MMTADHELNPAPPSAPGLPKMTIEFGIEGAARGGQRKDIVIVVDAIRATTTIPMMLSRGAVRVIPCESRAAVEAARPRWPRALRAGERQCRRIEGYDMGSSPGEISGMDLAGATILHSTTNGTRAVRTALDQGAVAVLTGSFPTTTRTAATALDLAIERPANGYSSSRPVPDFAAMASPSAVARPADPPPERSQPTNAPPAITRPTDTLPTNALPANALPANALPAKRPGITLVATGRLGQFTQEDWLGCRFIAARIKDLAARQSESGSRKARRRGVFKARDSKWQPPLDPGELWEAVKDSPSVAAVTEAGLEADLDLCLAVDSLAIAPWYDGEGFVDYWQGRKIDDISN